MFSQERKLTINKKYLDISKDEQGVPYDCRLVMDISEENITVNDCKMLCMELWTDGEEIGDFSVHWEMDVDDYVNAKTLNDIYWSGEITTKVHNLLQKAGFSKEASEDVWTSEHGMQDFGRASFDAYLLGAEMAKAAGLELEWE